jgi:hypothetical protein
VKTRDGIVGQLTGRGIPVTGHGATRPRGLDQGLDPTEPIRACGHRPRPQAGHMTASDLQLPAREKILASRGPSTHDPWGTRALPALASPSSRRCAPLSSGAPVRPAPGSGPWPARGQPPRATALRSRMGRDSTSWTSISAVSMPTPTMRANSQPWREARSQAAALIASSARFARSSRLVRSRRR